MHGTQGTRKRFVIIGGGPGGTNCATYAARFGADVTLIEKDIVGGAAHLLDCIPSKAMIATGGAMSMMSEAAKMGLARVDVELDFDALRTRIGTITTRLESSVSSLLESQNVRLINGTGRLVDDHHVEATLADGSTTVLEADVILISTGSRPRIPDWAAIDGERLLTTRHAYPPPELPEHLIVIGSGVTGVEFVHMFNSFGSKVTLIVSRQQVLPNKDPEVAAVLEQSFLDRACDCSWVLAPSEPRWPTAECRSIATTAASPRVPRTPRHRLDPEHRRSRARSGRCRDRMGLRQGRPQPPLERAAHLRGG
ncbi:MAG: FAD-dependent oxidoreductase [Acidimicrobiales bacterium]